MKFKNIVILLLIITVIGYFAYQVLLVVNAKVYGIFSDGLVQKDSLEAYKAHLLKSFKYADKYRGHPSLTRYKNLSMEEWRNMIENWRFESNQEEFEELEYKIRYIDRALLILEKLKKYKQIE